MVKGSFEVLECDCALLLDVEEAKAVNKVEIWQKAEFLEEPLDLVVDRALLLEEVKQASYLCLFELP